MLFKYNDFFIWYVHFILVPDSNPMKFYQQVIQRVFLTKELVQTSLA